jgi:hypothetical protein
MNKIWITIIIVIVIIAIFYIYKMKNKCKDDSPATVECILEYLKEKRKEVDREEVNSWTTEKKTIMDKVFAETSSSKIKIPPGYSLGMIKQIYNRKIAPCGKDDQMTSVNCAIDFLRKKREEVSSYTPSPRRQEQLNYLDGQISRYITIFRNGGDAPNENFGDFKSLVNRLLA